MSEADNVRRVVDGTRGMYEVWYVTWNDPATDAGFWLRFILESPLDEAPRGELWFARFDPARPERTFGIHRPFPIAQVSSRESPFALEIAGARMTHAGSSGELSGDGHDVRWDLRWDPAPETLRMVPDVMYARGGLGDTTPHSPNPRVPLSGKLVVDGETYDFDRAIAGQTHLWGKKHAFSWTWGRCAEFAGAPDAVLELLAVRLQRRGITTPRLAMATLVLDGEKHRLNQYRHVAMNRASWRTGHVELTARSSRIKLDIELSCSPDQLVLAPYLDPDGTRVYCANTEIGDARVVVSKRDGFRWREHRELVGHRRAHFETGGREIDPQVTRRHVRLV